MANLDTFLNVDQSISLRGLRKLSKAQLSVALNQNEELVKLRTQLHGSMSSLNYLLEHQNGVHSEMLFLQNQQLQNQKRFLQNQIEEIEFRQLQNFHRERIVRCKEILDDFKDSKDPYIQKVFINDFLQPAEILIAESKSELNEIADKEYCLNLKKDIRHILSNVTVDDVQLDELNILLESKSKLLEIQDKMNSAYELAAETSKAYSEQLNSSRPSNELLIKPDLQIPLASKGRLMWMGVLSFFSVLIILVIIIGTFQDGFRNVPGGVYFIMLPLCIYIILRFYWLRKKVTEFNIASEINRQTINEDTIKVLEQDRLHSENDFQFWKKEELKLRSSIKHLLSDVIYKHPEFLKFDYLLGLYKL